MENDFTVVIRRKPIEKVVTVRLASQIVNTPIETVKQGLREKGEFRDKRYIISLLAPHEEYRHAEDNLSKNRKYPRK